LYGVRRLGVHITLGIDIESISIGLKKKGFQLVEFISKVFMKHMKQSGLPSFPKHVERDMRNLAPDSPVARSTFSDKHMDMRVPFQVSAKGMHGRNHSRFKVFRLVKTVKPREHGIRAGFKKQIK
jgi:hypothetical protein